MNTQMKDPLPARTALIILRLLASSYLYLYSCYFLETFGAYYFSYSRVLRYPSYDLLVLFLTRLGNYSYYSS
jgi:hypothetical protein